MISVLTDKIVIVLSYFGFGSLNQGKKASCSVSWQILVELVHLEHTCFSWDAYISEEKTSKIKFTVAAVYIVPSVEKSKIIKFSAYLNIIACFT